MKPLMRKMLRQCYFVGAHTKTALEQKQDSYEASTLWERLEISASENPCYPQKKLVCVSEYSHQISWNGGH